MTSTDLATVAPSAGALALAGDQVDWTDVQRRALDHIGIAKAPAADQAVFLHVSQRTGLDPFAKQIYMIARKERGRNGEPDTIKWTIQTGIDGFRLIAERHPRYAGTLDPEWCGTDGVWREAWVDRLPPVAARVKVLRHDRAHPISLPVRFVEFAATFSDGNLQGQWKTKPAHMIGKVAEAAALRKAFPQDFSGLYIPEELERDDAHHQPVAAGRATEVVTIAELTGQGEHGAAPAPARSAATRQVRTVNVADPAPAAEPKRPAVPPAAALQTEFPPVAGQGDDEPCTPGQRTAMTKLLAKGGITTDTDALAVLARIAGRTATVEHLDRITAREARQVIEHLDGWQRARTLTDQLAAVLAAARPGAAADLPAVGSKAWHEQGHPVEQGGKVVTVEALMNGDCGICEQDGAEQ